jgi:hypothetical protein
MSVIGKEKQKPTEDLHVVFLGHRANAEMLHKFHLALQLHVEPYQY